MVFTSISAVSARIPDLTADGVINALQTIPFFSIYPYTETHNMGTTGLRSWTPIHGPSNQRAFNRQPRQRTWLRFVQAMSKTKEGGNHVERDAQFENIAAMILEFQSSGQPVVSVTPGVGSPDGFPFLIPTATASMVQITPGSRSCQTQVSVAYRATPWKLEGEFPRSRLNAPPRKVAFGRDRPESTISARPRIF